MGLEENQTVWIIRSNSGYVGPALLVGLIFGRTWLVKALKGEEQMLTVVADNIKVLEEDFSNKKNALESDEILEKEDPKQLKKKLKVERKNHRPKSRGHRRG